MAFSKFTKKNFFFKETGVCAQTVYWIQSKIDFENFDIYNYEFRRELTKFEAEIYVLTNEFSS